MLRALFELSAMRIAAICIQIGSKAFLIILLEPKHFGIFGVALVVITIIQRLTETGVNAALVRINTNIKDYLFIGLVANVFRGLVILIVVAMFAPNILSVFVQNVDSQVIFLVKIMAAGVFIESFKNVNLVEREIQLDFRPYIKVQISTLLSGAVTSIFMAYILRNETALVAGMVVSSIAAVISSYIFCDISLKLRWKNEYFFEILRYSRWVTGYTILGLIAIKITELIVIRDFSLADIGVYQTALFASLLIRNNLTEIFAKVLFPKLSSIGDRSERYRYGWEALYRFVTVFFVLSAVLYFCVAFLGPKILPEIWKPIVPLICIGIWPGFLQSISRAIEQLFKADGKPKIIFHVGLFEVALGSSAYFFYGFSSLEQLVLYLHFQSAIILAVNFLIIRNLKSKTHSEVNLGWSEGAIALPIIVAALAAPLVLFYELVPFLVEPIIAVLTVVLILDIAIDRLGQTGHQR